MPDLSGVYTHEFTEPADQPVWQIEPVGDGHRLTYLATAEAEPAWRLDAAGRAAFWDRMDWPAATSAAADCVSWGEPPAGIDDLRRWLTDTSPTAPARRAEPGAPGAGVLCRVPDAQRHSIGWLAAQTSEYFLFEPLGGVMEVRRLP